MSENVIKTLIVPAALDLPAAQTLRDANLQAMSSLPAMSSTGIILEAEAVTCTAPALQVLLATYRSLQSRHALAGLGTNATAILENVYL